MGNPYHSKLLNYQRLPRKWQVYGSARLLDFTPQILAASSPFWKRTGTVLPVLAGASALYHWCSKNPQKWLLTNRHGGWTVEPLKNSRSFGENWGFHQRNWSTNAPTFVPLWLHMSLWPNNNQVLTTGNRGLNPRNVGKAYPTRARKQQKPSSFLIVFHSKI
jgi:hypothetical protein